MANDISVFFIFTGGGSGGHVTVSLTILEAIKRRLNLDLQHFLYLGGGRDSLEYGRALELKIPYKVISTGKLARKFFSNHLKEFFSFLKGLFSCLGHFFDIPSKARIVVFASGGFVSVPVVFAAFLSKFLGRKITIYIHEQTSQAGLANKFCSYFANHVFISFEKSLPFFNEKKTSLSGYPLREDFYLEKPPTFQGMDLSSFKKPIIFFAGGGNGSRLINSLIVPLIQHHQKDYVIFHQTGHNFVKFFSRYQSQSYFPFSFEPNLSNLLKNASVIVTRSGAGICSEILHLRKKAIFVPLKIAQKEEQYYNAMEVIETLGFGKIIEEDRLNDNSLIDEINKLLEMSPPRSSLTEKKPFVKPSDFIVDFIISHSPFPEISS